MNVARPYTAVAPTVEGDVLMVLARHTTGLTGRAIARHVANGSHNQVSRALESLETKGLVLREQVGNSYLNTLNREHLACPAILTLEGMRQELLARMREEIAQWPLAPFSAVMFGSCARADGNDQSDIDVLLIRADAVSPDDDDWFGQTSDFQDKVFSWTGNRVHVIDLSLEEMNHIESSQGQQTAACISQDGILLAGQDVRKELRKYQS